MKTFQKEQSFQEDYYKKLTITKDVAFGKGKEWRLAIPDYLSRNDFDLQDKLVAEIGCGIGYFGASLIRDHKVSYVELLDIVPSLSGKIKELFEISNTQPLYKYICGDFIDLDLGESIYDYVFTNGAIHHAYNLRKYFEAVFRILKPGGFLVANEPSYSETVSYEDLKHTYEARLNFKASSSAVQNYPRHDFFFRLSEYFCMARYAGLEVYKIEPWGREKRSSRYSLKNLLLSRATSLKSQLSKSLFSQPSARNSLQVPSEHLLIFRRPSNDCYWRPHLDLLGIK